MRNRAGQAYVLRVPSNFRITLAQKVAVTCAEAIRALGDDLRWEVRSAGKGDPKASGGGYAWAWIGTASPRRCLLIRRATCAPASWPTTTASSPGAIPPG